MKIKFAPHNTMSFDNSLRQIIIDFPDALIDTIKVESTFNVIDTEYVIKAIKPSVIQTTNGYDVCLTLEVAPPMFNVPTGPIIRTGIFPEPEEDPKRGSRITDYWKDQYENDRIRLLGRDNIRYVVDKNNLTATFELNPGAAL